MRPKHLEPLEPRRLFAITIEGVEPAALDQPRINAFVRIPGQSLPLSANLGIFGDNEESFNIQAFYDTGASGALLSSETVTLLLDLYPEINIYAVTQNPEVPTEPNVVFSDVGVGGTQDFFVSVPLDIGLAPFNNSDPNADLDNPGTYQQVYNQVFTPIRTQIGMPAEDTNPLLSGLDVLGTPLMDGKVVVMDPKPVNTFLDTMRTYVYDPNTPFNPNTQNTDPGIPDTEYHIAMSYGDFERFTKVTPTGSPAPTLRDNPFIGSNPVRALDGLPDDGTPGVSMSNYGFNTERSFLFDTGAAASIISTGTADDLNVRYRAGTYGTDNPILEYIDDNQTVPGQFLLTIGGVGGTVTWAGFYMESMSIQTVEGETIEFPGAPVLVGDISALDDKGTPETADDQSIILDGIFGMNFLLASIFVSQTPGSIFPDLGAPVTGGFDWLVYDDAAGQLGLTLANITPNPRVFDQLFYLDDGGEQLFYVQFTRDVSLSLDASDLILTNRTTGFTLPQSYIDVVWEPSLNTATFSFPGYYPEGYLPDGNYRATILAESIDDGEYPLAEDYVFDFYFLNGDLNNDRKVDTRDFNVFVENYGQTLDVYYSIGDFNYDGDIDSLDFTLFTSQYGKSLPAITPLSADFDGDGKVNTNDFNVMAANFGQSGMTQPQGDCTGDGTIDSNDFTTFLSQYATSPLAAPMLAAVSGQARQAPSIRLSPGLSVATPLASASPQAASSVLLPLTGAASPFSDRPLQDEESLEQLQ